MVCERFPEESAAVKIMVWAPTGVPGFVGAVFEGEEELHPENEMRLAPITAIKRLARSRRWLSPRMRRGERRSRVRPAHAIPGSGRENPFREALVAAVVATVRVVVAAPLDGVTVTGAKVQVIPL